MSRLGVSPGLVAAEPGLTPNRLIKPNTVQRMSLGPWKELATGRSGRGYESQRFGLMQKDS